MMPPDTLSKEARVHFERIVKMLESANLIEDLDTDLVASYAIVCAQLERLDKEIEKVGLLVKTPKGPQANPLLRVYRQTTVQQIALARQLGLTPGSRGKLKSVSKSDGLDTNIYKPK
jgi:P27 family predicted phage terminase small subunit